MPVLRIRKLPVFEVTADPVQAARNFNAAMEEVAASLVERATEVEAASMCILTRSHLMLHGRHGIAKSMLASSIFDRIIGAEVYQKQFMKTTQTDEIFGPMNSKKYREDAIWEHNTKGYLPTAHFFYADEVYRASDQALPSLMGILNERIFFNGGVKQRCPLITAIGTTNFVTESEELEAFHDRWHVHVDSAPLSPGPSVRRMMRSFLDHPESVIKNTVTLEEIEVLQKQVKKVTVSDAIIEMADQMCAKLSDNLGKLYISDRRKCIALRFAQASAVLDGRDEMKPDDLEMMRFGLIKTRNQAHEGTWTNVSSNVIGSFRSAVTERKNLGKVDKYVKKLESMFHEKLGNNEATMIWKDAKRALSAISNQTAAEAPATREGIETQKDLVRRLESLLESLKDKVSS